MRIAASRPRARAEALCFERRLLAMNPSEIAAGMASITSVDDVEQLELLERLLSKLNPSSLCDEEYCALFGLFERFPEHDGFGVFWTILHRLEKSPQYEPHLLQSVQRQPAEFNLRMIARLVNGGVMQIGSVNLPALLRSVSTDQGVSESARAWACEFAH